VNITKIVSPERHIFHLKCTKFSFDSGATPNPPGVSYSAPVDQLNLRKGNGREGKEDMKGRKEREDMGRGFFRYPPYFSRMRL